MTDQPARTPYCTKIRYGITGAPSLHGSEMTGSYAPGVGVEPVLIELVYSAPLKDRPASVSASVTGLWTQLGKRDQPERTVDVHFNDGPDGWPAWLAGEARRHDPDVKLAAAHAQTLRDAAEICDEAGAGYTSKALNEHADAAYTLMERLQRKAEEAEGPAEAGCVCDPGPYRENDGTYSHWAGCPIADAQQQATQPAP